MSKDKDLVRLRHMRSHAAEALGLASPQSREDLDKDRLLALGLVRLMEIVGEAAARVSPKMTTRYSDLPWPEIVSLRNRLIHGYDAVDLDILWQVITIDLPPLIKRLDELIAEQD